MLFLLDVRLGKRNSNFAAIVYLQLCRFCSDGFPLTLGAWDILCYFIMGFPYIFLHATCLTNFICHYAICVCNFCFR